MEKKFCFQQLDLKLEFLGPFTGPRNPLKKVLHIPSVFPPNFIFWNKIICFKTKIFSGIIKQNENKTQSTLEQSLQLLRP